MHDFGIIGMTMPQYDPSRCVACQACIKGCRQLSVDALRLENYKIVRDEEKCIGCGVCVTKCPTRALTRSKKKYYKLAIMGRTGKKNPRLGEDFLVWADAENIIKIIKNTYKFVGKIYFSGCTCPEKNISAISSIVSDSKNIKNGH